MNSKDFAKRLKVGDQEYLYFDIQELESRNIAPVGRLPFSIRILVENLIRHLDGRVVKEADVRTIAAWKNTYEAPVEIPYHPARVLMQDFTGVPAVVDLAAMRDAVKELGGDPATINPLVPVELVVDHSVQIDYYGTRQSLEKNVAKEYARNSERYKLLKWAQKSFHNFQVVPPNSGICHQVNLEHLGRVVIADKVEDNGWVAYPDTLVGTDSHTTMINAIGVMGWGVGGIEAEAVMLGQPYYMSIPEVIGVRLSGRLKEGITATDLVLRVTEQLRRLGVVEKFVEFYGPGLKHLSVPDRATIANMSPEYGATMGFFPVDEKTLEYLRITNRGQAAALTEAYTKAAALFYTGAENPEYTQVVELDLTTIEPSLAGPARPQDRIALSDMKGAFAKILGCEYDRETEMQSLSRFNAESGNVRRALNCHPLAQRELEITLNDRPTRIGDGHVVIAAITSCTNTSNPHVLIGAGLLAKAAVERGLKVSPVVKTSLAPGSKVVSDYLQSTGLTPYLDALGFHLAAFGCTTCIGNSGPLHPVIEQTIAEHNLNVAAVLSGNRNFEARIHQNVKSNFLASPMLVVAYALAGRVDIDPTIEPLGLDPNGEPVYLDQLWPSHEAIDALVNAHVKQQLYADEYGRIFDGDQFWQSLQVTESTTYAWEPDSTYIKNPPYFDDFKLQPAVPAKLENARVFLHLGDSVTTDHISPAGAIPEHYPAGRHLIENGVAPEHFNSYGSRRGNHEVMMRGTFANVRIKNKLIAPKEGGRTLKFPEAKEMFNYDAAIGYQQEGTPLLILGGKEYGTGSSRDWAAKGTQLLGIKAVLAESYERIHRNNLVGMGVLPLMFKPGESTQSLGLDGSETYTIEGMHSMTPRKSVTLHAVKANGETISFEAIARLDTDVDVSYFAHGGILPYVLRKLMAESSG
jgi:aconitate hydratase